MGYNKVYETRSFCRIDSFEKKEKKGEGKMKDFFEDLGKRLGETAETVTNKASEAIEIQRLKSKVRGLARENAVDLMEMGRMIYENYKEGGEVGEEAEQLCRSISGREDSMKKFNKKIAELKGAFECKSCGKMVEKCMSFCPYCGTKAEEEVYEGEVFDGEAEEENTAGDSVKSDDMKEKAADAAKNMAEKAGKAAKRAGEMAEKAAKKTSEMAEKAADKVDDIAGKAAEKAEKAAEKAADKLKD